MPRLKNLFGTNVVHSFKNRKEKALFFKHQKKKVAGRSSRLRFAPLRAKVKQFEQISLSDQCKYIICGTLLGDGCLQLTAGAQHARLSIRHTQAQREYFDWKVSQLQEIASPKSVQEQSPDKNSYSKQKKLLFQSRALEALTKLYQITYKQKRLSIRRRWLNQMSPLSLAIWWCDDGSIIGSKEARRKGVLCTDGFDEKSVRKLAQYLEKVWDVRTHVGATNRSAAKRSRKYGNYTQEEYFRIWFGTEELKKWLRIIMPYIPVASMIYKTILIYKDSRFQQRWISEMKKALPHFSTEIDKAVAATKLRAKNKAESDKAAADSQRMI